MVNDEERFIDFLRSRGYRLLDGYRASVTPIGNSRKFRVELVKDG